MAVDFSEEIKTLRATMDQVREVTNLDALRSQISDLEKQASVPDLWDDQERAQQVTSALSRANTELERVVGMDQRVADLETLVEMGTEDGGDAETMAEAERELAALKRDVGELEVRTLLSGEYDEREAVVTIRSGAGGVDAADFAEMLMRMYLRWAERHEYPTSVLDTSYAEEAGLKSATFEVKAPYAFGHLTVEAGTHRLVRISPFDNQGRRQTSFAAVEVIPLIESSDSIEIPENEIKVDVFRSSGPGGQSVNTTDSAVRMTAHPHRHRRLHAEREVPDPEPRRRPAGAPVPAAAGPQGGGGRRQEGDGRRHQGQLGRPDAVLLPASLPDGQGPAHRSTRSATPARSSTATSTTSSRPASAGAAPARRSRTREPRAEDRVPGQ